VKRVYKYALPVEDIFTLTLPFGAELLHVDEQHGAPCLWALVNPDATSEQRRFRLAGTGHPIEIAKPMRHVGTFFLHGGELVFHLFEILDGAMVAS
jgi:hypothetical protein